MIFFKKIFGEVDSDSSPVKCMVGCTCDYMKSGIHDCLSDIDWRSKTRIIRKLLRIVGQRGLLIDDSDITVRDNILHIFKQKCKCRVMLQTITVNWLMRHDITKYGKRNLCVLPCKTPRIPYPAAHLVAGCLEPESGVRRFLSVGHNIHDILPDVGGHPLWLDGIGCILVHKKVLRPTIVVFLDPEWLMCTILPFSPAQKYKFIHMVIVHITGKRLLYHHVFRRVPDDICVIFHRDFPVFQNRLIYACLVTKRAVIPRNPTGQKRAETKVQAQKQ